MEDELEASLKMRTLHKSLALIVMISLLFLGCNAEKRDWQTANKQDTIQAYQDFISKYPKSIHVSEANEKIDWEKVRKEGSFQEYHHFVINYPKSVHVSEANERIRDQVGKELVVACSSLDRGILVEAAPIFQKVLTVDPENPFALNNIVYTRLVFAKLIEDSRRAGLPLGDRDLETWFPEIKNVGLLEKSLIDLKTALPRAEKEMYASEANRLSFVYGGDRGAILVYTVEVGEQNADKPLKDLIELNISAVQSLIANNYCGQKPYRCK